MPVPQYDAIGDRYTEVANLPTGFLQQAAMKALVGDISGLTVLDLACNTGSYTHKTVTEWGARHAVGVDISPLTIDIARRRARNDPRV
ncbi:class I SAM-dependent methyltransferase [Aspergillus affinis]|uniref:class I SAM-dependent methyltransferase n=1 Tax=Aspergillus affinis TaxID=1070780 RepID=UPI0022FDDDB0|nr:S-adenosyl-L-methionine-dependent methyltransferase [Aspergillus affinis]KAI9037546.1 S-adenosyl-L-methionine-dependent methyltransferase [Aspergillus affinis]